MQTVRVSELAKTGTRGAVDAAATIIEQVLTSALSTQMGAEAALAVGSATGAMMRVAPDLAFQLRADRRRRGAAMLDQAGGYAGMSVDDLVLLLSADEAHRYLLYRTVQAAADSISESKTRTLAAALASGALSSDPAAVDEALLVVAAVAPLEAPHVRLLEILATVAPEWHVGDSGEEWQSPPSRRESWTRDELAKRLNAPPAAVVNIVATLQALGMVERTAGTGYGSDLDFSTKLTGFGEMCMKHLIDLGRHQQST